MSRRIIIAAHKGHDLISKLIALQTRTYGGYSHISLVVLPEFKQIEAYPGGVVVRDGFEAHDSDVDFFTVDASEDAIDRMVAFAQGEVGCPYDYMGDVRFVTRFRGENDKKWFCSELAYASLAAGGVNLFRDTQAWEVSPGMLVRSPVLIQLSPEAAKALGLPVSKPN